jgi:hypothetical protein
MLLSTYMYALYKDKNRQTPFEFFKKIKAKALSATNSGNNSTTTSPPTTTPAQKEEEAQAQPLSWDNAEDRPFIVAMVIVFIFEFVLLYFAILMAIRVSKTKTQLFLHLFAAIFFTLPYIVLNTIFETGAYRSLTVVSSYSSYSSPSERMGSSRFV